MSIEPIAIIGMAGRFPGARDVQSLWANVCVGVESVERLSEAQLVAAGATDEWLSRPSLVRTAALAEGLDRFDAAFFGISPRDAELMDPQLRIALETVWEALEDAGLDPARDGSAAGVFMSAGISSYLAFNLLPNKALIERAGAERFLIFNDKDFYPTTISYRLDLRGPSVSVGTACSSSLTAVHMACQSLRADECDVAIAGGCSINVPLGRGYLYTQDGIYSPDGHCRVFDAAARGTVGADGAAFVVLQRGRDAARDRRRVHALLRGSACNNDGALKAGYTAPSVDGQSRVVREALRRAEVGARDIAYVEAHGTGTILGDPIEVAALTEAFRSDTPDVAYCALGALKANVGHLDAAAGVAGLIKAALIVREGLVPPAVNVDTVNPHLRLAESPFFVNRMLSPWPSAARPRLAGVSAFGVGGTNVHMILQEPEPAPPRRARGPWIVPVSARNQPECDAAIARLRESLDQAPALANVEFTCARGRKQFSARRAFVVSTREELSRRLAATDARAAAAGPSTLWFFAPPAGVGSPLVGCDLFEQEPRFRRLVLQCVDLIVDPARVSGVRRSFEQPHQSERSENTPVSRVRAFTFQYALARLLMEWGLTPAAILGVDVGSLVAAALTESLSLADAIALAGDGGLAPATRAMAVMLSPGQLARILPREAGIAAVCAPDACVVTGPAAVLASLRPSFARARVACRWLGPAPTAWTASTASATPTTSAASTTPAVREQTGAIACHPPRIAIIRGDTGSLIDAGEQIDWDCWDPSPARTRTWRLDEGLRTAARHTGAIGLELGAGRLLPQLLRRNALERMVCLPGLTTTRGVSELGRTLEWLGTLWERGTEIDWSSFLEPRGGGVCSLPSYPFQSRRCWVDAPVAGDGTAAVREAAAANTIAHEAFEVPPKREDIQTWFHVPAWRPWTPPPASRQCARQRWVVFGHDEPITTGLRERMRAGGHEIVIVRPRAGYVRLGARDYAIRVDRAGDYAALVDALGRDGRVDGIVHAWTLRPSAARVTLESMDAELTTGLHSLLFAVQALGRAGCTTPLRLVVITNNTQAIEGGDVTRPEHASLKAAVKIVPQEYPNIRGLHIDLDLRSAATDGVSGACDGIAALLQAGTEHTFVAHRAGGWLRDDVEPVAAKPPVVPARLAPRGLALITGGLGGVGLRLAECLARESQARLVLVGRTAIAPRSEWPRLAANDSAAGATIRQLQRIEGAGAELVTAAADVCDRARMKEVIAEAEERFGPVRGVVHAAGIVDTAGVIQRRTREATDLTMAAKVRGAMVLETLLRDRPLDFFVCCSSLGATLYQLKFGEIGYVAANDFLGAYCHDLRARGLPAIAVGWTDWREAGMSAEALKQRRPEDKGLDALIHGMTSAEGIEAFRRVLALNLPEVLVSTQDLQEMLRQQAIVARHGRGAFRVAGAAAPAASAQPGESNPVDIEQALRTLWQDLLGVSEIDPADDFFTLGGDSLVAVRLIARLKETFGVEQNLAGVFEHSTFRAQADSVRRARTVSVA